VSHPLDAHQNAKNKESSIKSEWPSGNKQHHAFKQQKD